MVLDDSGTIIENIKNRINSLSFMVQQRRSDKDFTRKRKLPFASLVLFMLNLVRSTLQKELTNFMTKFSTLTDSAKKISKSAFSQSRSKLNPEAFIDLNEEILKVIYRENNYKKWNGFRLLVYDGSTLQLPYSEEIREAFGFNLSPSGKKLPLARISSCYDPLNDFILDAEIGHYKTDDYDFAIKHLEKLGKDDLLLLDRWYAAIWMFYSILNKGSDFVIRLPKNFIIETDKFWNSEESSKIIEITNCPRSSKLRLKELGLTFKPFKLRLVKVILDNGEIEVLATSLLDEDKYPVSIFKDLYFLRWGVEVNYDHLKNQVEVENFTGLTPFSVKQDFFANIFITNLQAAIARDCQPELDKVKDGKKYEYKINKNLSLGYMKDRIITILTSDDPRYIEEIKNLFLVEPIPIRKGRKFPRQKKSKRKKYFINKRRAL